MPERGDEAPEGRRLAEQGNTHAKLFVPEDSEDKDELQERAPEDAEASGVGEPEGGKGA
ncbi:MAG: hypothetical protein M3350_08730 [Actinomycetota bacterium]|nr:hypothetical protein [Actinomycetota bacterium]MDQ3720846.1 hypothetical protein [Actinomycetota bacterium]